MIEQEFGRMRPLYEAMSVGSSTVEWLERKEQERSDFDLQFQLAKLSRAMEEFVELAGKDNPLREVPKHVLNGFIFCVETLNCMTQTISARTREHLPAVSQVFQQTIELILGQIDVLADRIEEIYEAWQMAVDDTMSAQIDGALASIDRNKTDIPDWRETLELIPD